MKLNQISFKGYDAAPLKRIHTDYNYSHVIKSEMNDISSKEKIDFVMEYDNDPWFQDSKTIVCNNKRKFVLTAYGVQDPFFKTLEHRYKISHLNTSHFLVGGNSFIGKMPDGKRWILAGRNTLKNPEKILDTPYCVARENVFILPQQNFHLDMYLRPIGYPYVLVNDPDLVCENVEKLGYAPYEINPKNYYNAFKRGYCSVDETIKKLKEFGFKPIKIAGDYSHGINFMNAIVNKHQDGTVSYITNSSNTEMFKTIQEQFEKDLRQKVSNIDKVYFVSGRDGKPQIYWNYMMYSIENLHGGLHCMTMEEPDFDAWG